MSDGSISSTQINRMGKRAYHKFLGNGQIRMATEAQIRMLEKSSEELLADHRQQLREKDRGRAVQLKNIIAIWRRVGIGKRGTTRPTYQRQIDAAEIELSDINARTAEAILNDAWECATHAAYGI